MIVPTHADALVIVSATIVKVGSVLVIDPVAQSYVTSVSTFALAGLEINPESIMTNANSAINRFDISANANFAYRNNS